eukprot:gene6902-14014_t
MDNSWKLSKAMADDAFVSDEEDNCCLLLSDQNEKVFQLIDKLKIISVLNDPLKLVWETIRYEATSIAKGDLQAATIMATSVLAQPSFQEAVIDFIANHLKTPLLPATQIRNLFTEVCIQKPELPYIWALDIIATSLRDSSRPNAVSVLLFNKGFHALVVYRVANQLWHTGRDGLARYFQSLSSRMFAADIHPACNIGHSCMVASTTSIVIGETAVVGDDACILHGVTLGGTGKESGDRHPKLGRGVYMGSGSTILGNIQIGDGAVIEAGSVVTKAVPPFTRVNGVPGRIVSKYRVDADVLDKINSIDARINFNINKLRRVVNSGADNDIPSHSEETQELSSNIPTEKVCFHGQGVGT